MYQGLVTVELLDFLVGGGGIGRWRQMGEEAVRSPTVTPSASASLRAVSSVGLLVRPDSSAWIELKASPARFARSACVQSRAEIVWL